ncbi:hypothetical protein LJB42_004367 [Komagataella kurtzmanii]|nr:hypothetical protein LJB42_004367 [Komagataella kurtzmanii]
MSSNSPTGGGGCPPITPPKDSDRTQNSIHSFSSFGVQRPSFETPTISSDHRFSGSNSAGINYAPRESMENSSMLRNEPTDLDLDLALGGLSLDFDILPNKNQSNFLANSNNRHSSLTPNSSNWSIDNPSMASATPRLSILQHGLHLDGLNQIKPFELPGKELSGTEPKVSGSGSFGPALVQSSPSTVNSPVNDPSVQSLVDKENLTSATPNGYENQLPLGFSNMGRGYPHPMSHGMEMNLDMNMNVGFNNGMPMMVHSQGIWPPHSETGLEDEFANHRLHTFPHKSRSGQGNRNSGAHHPSQQHLGGSGGHSQSALNNSNIGRLNNGMNTHRKNMRKRGEDPSKFADAKLEDFQGEIYSLCKDQHGCRFLQKQLDIGGKNAATMIFNETYLSVIELMSDPFGNYLIQKLLDKVSVDQRITLVRNASPKFVRIALDPHGTRALQKLVECIDTEEESEIIIDALSSHVVSLSRDLNGNHVVQKCLQKLSSKDCQFIFDAACDHCVEIATHRHGCCVLQRCLDHGSKEQCYALSLEVSRNCIPLSFDPFGNYVVQYVLSQNEMIKNINDSKPVANIVAAIKDSIITLSLHKFGSNVIEKCLKIPRVSKLVIDQLLETHATKISELLNDPYGNYVLQTALDVSTPEEFERLSELLKPLLPTVRNTPHGKRIMARIQVNGVTPSNNQFPVMAQQFHHGPRQPMLPQQQQQSHLAQKGNAVYPKP